MIYRFFSPLFSHSHLANHIRPRSVGSIHVPSAAVPKLTMARCRRNVDNFLEACRKIGVDEVIFLLILEFFGGWDCKMHSWLFVWSGGI
jgi:hypothetical protein